VAGLAKFNTLREKPLVLLSPLHWGLGHTTRCIPLIRELILLDCDVVIACTASQRKLLEKEFQSLTFFDSPQTQPSYGKNKFLTLVSLLLQTPKILTSIKQENRWLREFLSAHPVDAIISDNRFGLYAPGIPCIFITHQINVKTGLGRLFDGLARRINYRFIEKFTACWVPDAEVPQSLSGELSHPAVYPKIDIARIGAMSRFEMCAENTDDYLLIILSGPEPQRTLLEKKIIEGLWEYKGKAILVRGTVDYSVPIKLPNHVAVHPHLQAARLNTLICAASMVISRCGYTTVMDLMKLQKKAVLIPTPGQAEQEYLSQYLHEKQFAYTVSQNDFSLASTLQAAHQFPYKKYEASMDTYKSHLAEFVKKLKP
jgi:uncharacterized protein (TIGR00661 family)